MSKSPNIVDVTKHNAVNIIDVSRFTKGEIRISFNYPISNAYISFFLSDRVAKVLAEQIIDALETEI